MTLTRNPWPSSGAVVAGGVSLAGYLATVAPGLTWAHDGADGGDLAAAVAGFGVPHPTGYPTYVVLGRLFALLPVGDVAFRLNLMSAVCAALAVAILYLVVYALLGGEEAPPWLRGVVALSAALVFAFSPVYWSQAVITEVYALNALFVATLLWLAQGQRLTLMAVVLGLGLGNHVTLVLLVPALLSALRGQAGRPGQVHTWARASMALVCGLLVYAYLPLSAARQPLVNWGQADTLDGFLWMLSGGPYRSYAFALPVTELPARLAAWATHLVQQLSWPGVTLMLLGLWDMLGSDNAAAGGRLRQAVWGQGMAVLLYSIHALGYRTRDSYLYLIPVYLIACLWLGHGLWLVVLGLQNWLRSSTRGGWAGKLPLAAAVVCVLAVSGQYGVHQAGVDLSNDRAAQAYAQDVFAQLPTGAVVITASDEHSFSLWYYQVVQGRRDALIVDRDLAQFSWYRRQITRAARVELGTDPLETTAYVAALMERLRGSRTIFLADEDSTLLTHFRWQRQGVLYRLE